MAANGETAPLLGENVPNLARDPNFNGETAPDRARRAATVRAITYGVLTTVFVVALVVMLFLWNKLTGVVGRLPKDPHRAALIVLQNSPVIVSTMIYVYLITGGLCFASGWPHRFATSYFHLRRNLTETILADLPILVRSRFANNVSAVDLEKAFPGHLDIPRLHEGKVGGFFWSVYVDCPGLDEGDDYLNATWRVRCVLAIPIPVSLNPHHVFYLSDTLEQIDVAKLLINKYPDVSAHPASRASRLFTLLRRRSAMRSPRRTSRRP